MCALRLKLPCQECNLELYMISNKWREISAEKKVEAKDTQKEAEKGNL